MKNLIFFFGIIFSFCIFGQKNENTSIGAIGSQKNQETIKQWKIWKTVKYTNHKSSNEVKKSFAEKGILYRSSCVFYADKKFMRRAKFTENTKEEIINLVLLSPQELGVKDSGMVSYSKICRSAKRLGLKLCTPNIAIALREQYLNQSDREGERIFLAMNIKKSFLVTTDFNPFRPRWPFYLFNERMLCSVYIDFNRNPVLNVTGIDDDASFFYSDEKIVFSLPN
ncbi:MAG: hypothetical protein US50_C0001G0002 [Candidatus Nomurabacteria bacterium GW2011_GWB1_37_5]|uniref:Uncharacterized protein n=1 Tax=Candidatus Nomurabacteria bacterium GW2011_GWB1_37_5 TaxID=1618742 RepID=A0A0G0HBR3_9BACT|nr:MAG: hypothetical protein US50_C0001G0002 [Candidatus Nomurabacteria bacterium GW2011_GWB1_37_5]